MGGPDTVQQQKAFERNQATLSNKEVVYVQEQGGLAPFSPSSEGIFNFETRLSENALFYLILYQISKTNPEKAYKLLETIVLQSSAILQDYVRAGSANMISAFGSARAVGYWFERMGMFTKAQALDYASGLAIMAGLQVANQWHDLIPWVRQTTDDKFPDSVNLGDKVTHFEWGIGRAPSQAKLPKEKKKEG